VGVGVVGVVAVFIENYGGDGIEWIVIVVIGLRRRLKEFGSSYGWFLVVCVEYVWFFG